MEPKTKAGALFGQESNVYGTSVHRPKDDMLNKVTIVCGVIFVISLIALLAVKWDLFEAEDILGFFFLPYESEGWVQ